MTNIYINKHSRRQYMKGKQLNDEDLDAIFGGVALNEDQIKKLGSITPTSEAAKLFRGRALQIVQQNLNKVEMNEDIQRSQAFASLRNRTL